ncbi:tetratricopeptide repeat protein [Mucilaginibacter sp. dw_454]|uniref:tetratricopeptide repeat protein n=1 Tax=Mucilaginibacter sp. dw_454 TaxID=2720079 RepID=UPI001BD5BBF0|nr:tetratricopeptide repeat protein [Mucilaginibacter sp. dw_454]
MKRFLVFVFLTACCLSTAWAQNADAALAKQFSTNGEYQKALDIYQKLYKQDNETYFSAYVNTLISLKKYDEAESTAKKIIRKHPGMTEYVIVLGSVYTQHSQLDKANALYDDLIKALPADQGAVSLLASQFYQLGNADFAIKTFLQGRKLLHSEDLFSYELITMYRFKRDKAALTEEYLNLLPHNPLFRSQAENAFATLFENDADYEILRVALLKRIQKDPEQIIYVELLVWQFLQQKDFDQALNQSLALNRRTNGDGSDIFQLCSTLLANDAYDVAIRGYEYLISLGKDKPYYVSSRIELINAKNLKVTAGKYVPADLAQLEKDYIDLLAEFGKTSATAFAMQRLASLEVFKLHKLPEAQKILEEAVKINGIQPTLLASCKLDLGDVYLLNGQPWEATLLYSQVEKDYPNTNMGQDAKFRNAKFAYYTGDFTWAKGQLDVLKAATSQLIANDALNLSLLIADNSTVDSTGAALKIYARADLQIFAEQQDKAVKILDSIDVKYPNNQLSDDILMAKARIAIQQKNYNDAVADLKKIVAEHPNDLWADDAVFMLGDIYENQLNDKEQAKSYYQKIITDYSGSLYINDARKRFRILRGDVSS